MFLASYQSDSDAIISYLEQVLHMFEKLKRVFDKQELGSNGEKLGHLDIP
jgi:hypothetical protein